jgi:hypothetical protein
MEQRIYDDYKWAKIRLINKYKKFSKELARQPSNENTFISINDFLASEPSLGPNADPGIIQYHYTHFENVNDFIKILIEDIYYNEIVCLSNFFAKFKNRFIVGNTFSYNLDLDYLDIPVNAIKEIDQCIQFKRFIYINLNIFWERDDMGHANMLLIDNLEKTIERFEPYGKSWKGDKQNLIAKKIDSKFNEEVLEKIKLKGYKYISPVHIQPVIGFQAKADAYDGMCVTFSLIYLHLRLMNPDIKHKVIIKYLLSKKKDEIVDIILKYARYIELSLKKNAYRVNLDRNKLYYKDFDKIQNYLRISEGNIKTINF